MREKDRHNNSILQKPKKKKKHTKKTDISEN